VFNVLLFTLYLHINVFFKCKGTHHVTFVALVVIKQNRTCLVEELNGWSYFSLFM